MAERLIWLVPAAVAALGLWRPRAGLVCLVAALPLFGSPPGGPYLGALEAAGLAAVLTAWRAGRPARPVLTWTAAAFVAASLLTLVPSPFQPPSWRPGLLLELLAALPGVESWPAVYTWRAAADLMLGWGLFLAVRRAFAGRSIRPLALALLSSLTVTLLLGLASLHGLDLGAYRPALGVSSGSRLQSVFFLSGWLAEYVVLATPVAVAALAATAGLARLWIAPVLALALTGLALTQQRGAWVAAAVQFGVLAAFLLIRSTHRSRTLKKGALVVAATLILALGVVVIAGDGLAPLVDRARSVQTGFSPRLPLWSAAIQMTRERPLLGVGLGAFTPAYDRLHPRGSPEARANRGTAHNLYLHVAAERGALGLAALGLLAWGLGSCVRRPRDGQETYALALGLSLVGLAAYGLVQYMFYLRNIAWLCWILAGCAAAAARDPGPAGAERAARALCLVAVLLLPVRLLLEPPPPWPGRSSFGFHESESLPDGEPYRWTAGFAAERLPWECATLRMELANGHPRAAERPATVVVAIDGKTLDRLTVAGGWQEHLLDIGEPVRESIVLSLEVKPTFRPFSEYRGYPELRPSQDIRELGIAVKGIRWHAPCNKP